MRTTVACVDCPGVKDGALSVTVTDATGAGGGVVIEIDAFPTMPSLVAMIVADPALTPVTTPLLLTVATEGAELLHAMIRSDSTAPDESFVTAEAIVVLPTWIEEEPRLTAIDATGTELTAMEALALTLSADAITLVLPTLFARSIPESETVATVVSELRQDTGTLLTTRPDASLASAVRRLDVPMRSIAFEGVTWIVATGPAGRAIGPDDV